jgi:hypothetical protein
MYLQSADNARSSSLPTLHTPAKKKELPRNAHKEAVENLY